MSTKTIKLPPRIKSLEGVPERYHGLYEEQDGEFLLSREVEIEDVGGLKSALEKEREARSRAEKLAKRFEGIDLDEVETMRAEKARAEQAEAERKGEYQKLLAKQKEGYDKEIGALRSERDALRERYHQRLQRTAVTEALAKAGGNVMLLTPHVVGQTKVMVGEDGEEAVVVVDAKGNPKIGRSGDAMTLDELVSSLREDATFQPAFAGNGSSGGGGRQNTDGPAAGGANGGGSGRRKIPAGYDPSNHRDFNRLQDIANKEGATFVDAAGAIVVAPIE